MTNVRILTRTSEQSSIERNNPFERWNSTLVECTERETVRWRTEFSFPNDRSTMKTTSSSLNDLSSLVNEFRELLLLCLSATVARPKSPQVLIDAEIRHPADNEEKSSKSRYPFPSGSISSPNYPQNYSNNIVRKRRKELSRHLVCLIRYADGISIIETPSFDW